MFDELLMVIEVYVFFIFVSYLVLYIHFFVADRWFVGQLRFIQNF